MQSSGFHQSLPSVAVERKIGRPVYEIKLPTEEHLSTLYVLNSVKGFGSGKFKIIYEQYLLPQSILDISASLPVIGKVGMKLRDKLQSISGDTITQSKD